MLSLILNNIKSIGYGLAVAALFTSGVWVGVQISHNKLERALKAQSEALIAQCNTDKQLTSEVSKEYENKISTLSNRVAALKRLSATKCVSVTSPARIADGSTADGLPNVDGIPADTLIDYAGEAEKQRQQLISLQEFVGRVWKR